MSAAWIVKAVEVFKDCQFCSAASVPRVPPDPFGLDYFEECFDDGVIISISLAIHGYFLPMLAQAFLIFVRGTRIQR